MPVIEQYESRGLSQTYGQDTRFLIYVIDSGDPDTASADPDLPDVGDEWPTDPDLICVNRDVFRIAPTYCHCVATFAERVQEETFDCSSQQQLVTMDIATGNAIGPFINKQPQGVGALRATHKQLVITRWETDVDEAALSQMCGPSVNTLTWRGWAGTLTSPEAAGHWLFTDFRIVSTRALTFSPPLPAVGGQLAQVQYTFLLSTETGNPSADGWGPGWFWTWYNRDQGTGAKLGGAQASSVYPAVDFGPLDLDPTP